VENTGRIHMESTLFYMICTEKWTCLDKESACISDGETLIDFYKKVMKGSSNSNSKKVTYKIIVDYILKRAFLSKQICFGFT